MSEEVDEWRRRRLKDAAHQHPEGMAGIGRAIGYKNGAFIAQMIDGRRRVTEKTIEKIHELRGYQGWFRMPVVADLVASYDIAGGRDGPIAPQLAAEATPTALARPAHLVAVPVLSNAGSMGGGTDQLHDDVIVGTLPLDTRWINQRVRPSSPEALRFIHAYGNSMEPTFSDGDVLLVDAGVRDIRIDGIFVLQAQSRLFVKRVRQRLDGGFVVSSDNPTDKTVDELKKTDDVTVLGRVVWCWNGRKL